MVCADREVVGIRVLPPSTVPPIKYRESFLFSPLGEAFTVVRITSGCLFLASKHAPGTTATSHTATSPAPCPRRGWTALPESDGVGCDSVPGPSTGV